MTEDKEKDVAEGKGAFELTKHLVISERIGSNICV